jgi:hypothetical protein
VVCLARGPSRGVTHRRIQTTDLPMKKSVHTPKFTVKQILHCLPGDPGNGAAAVAFIPIPSTLWFCL